MCKIQSWITTLFLLAMLFSSSFSEAKKGDDGWKNNNNRNLPSSSSSSSNKKNKKENTNKKKKKSKDMDNENKGDDDKDDNNNSANFQTSLTFIPQQELADPKLMKLVNSPWNNPAKQEELDLRLKAFVRSRLVDQDKVDELTKRTRKDWEDMEITINSQLVLAMAKLVANLLKDNDQSPIHKLLHDRDAQEQIRLYLLGLLVQIRSFLNDPGRQKLLTDSDQWYSLFDKIKSWEGAPHEQVLVEFLDFIDRREEEGKND